MRSTIVAVLVVELILTVFLVTSPSASAQSTSELLERAIYTEETVGDLDQAIEIYQSIVDQTAAQRPQLAEALFRLGMCHLKNDDATAATEVFERVISDYSDQETWVARAHENMPDDPDNLEMLAAPWEDGEVSRMALKLASGVEIGALIFAADRVDVEGEEMWRVRTRRKVLSSADNQAISEVIARIDDFLPVESTFKHTVVGHFEADFGPESISVLTVGPDTTREQPIEGKTFDNEQGFFLFRRLPLEVGYEKTIKFIAPWAGGANPVKIEVPEIETVTVSAGEFDCYRMDFGVPQKFWYSVEPPHHLVKLEAAGIVGELEEVYNRDPRKSLTHTNDEMGFSVALPPEWLAYEHIEHGTHLVVLLDPRADMRTGMEVYPVRDHSAFQTIAAGKLDSFRDRFKNYALRDATWDEREVGGRPSVRFVGDYEEDGKAMVVYWTYVESGELSVEFIMMIAAEKFDAARPAMDSIIESYDGPRAAVAPPAPADPTTEAVKDVLTDFHFAASIADTDRYFAHYAPDMVFLGTDRTERYDMDGLRAMAEPYFSKGQGWVASPLEQNVVVSADGTMAWFDERLDSRSFGEMRASGVLRRDDDRWRVVQYNVAFAVPNQLVAELVPKIIAADPEVEGPDDEVSPAFEGDTEEIARVRAVLNDLHRAASEADIDRYYGHVAPDAIFYGTDRSERYDVARSRAFVEPYFAQGRGWTSVPREQNIFLSPDGTVAWFDERLGRKGVGEMRGSGVLKKVDGVWKVVHYNKVIPVPNELAVDLVERIRRFYSPES